MPSKQHVWDGVNTWIGIGTPDITAATANPRDSLVPGTYKPDATNTGPLPGTAFTQVGSDGPTSTDFIVSAHNQIVENLEIWGSIRVGTYNNVTIQNCIIHGTLTRGSDTGAIILGGDNGRGLLIKDCKIEQRPNNHNEWCTAMRGGNYTILRTEISGFPDGLAWTSQLGNVVAESNWIHNGWFNEWTQAEAATSQGGNNYYPYAGSYYTHVDGIQFHRGKNYVIRGNMIGGVRVPGNHHMSPSEKDAINSGDDLFNAALMVKQEVDTQPINKIENVLIEKNWFAGGASTLNVTYGRDNLFETVVIQDNKFMRPTWGQQYHILRGRDGSGTPVAVFTNNTFEDDGSPVPINWG